MEGVDGIDPGMDVQSGNLHDGRHELEDFNWSSHGLLGTRFCKSELLEEEFLWAFEMFW